MKEETQVPVLTPNLMAETSLVVDAAHSASRFTPWALDVLSTPDMIGLMEKAADIAGQSQLPAGFATVGTLVEIKHLAACPRGWEATARATLLSQQGRRLVFRVECFAAGEKLGEGVHERFIVHRERFMARTAARWASKQLPAGD
jgi:predicted thioesterase